MVIIGEHSNTRKRLAAVSLGTAVDEIALVDIMERHDEEINNIVVDDGIMTSFITIHSTTASPKTAELLLAAAARGYAAVDCQCAQR